MLSCGDEAEPVRRASRVGGSLAIQIPEDRTSLLPPRPGMGSIVITIGQNRSPNKTLACPQMKHQSSKGKHLSKRWDPFACREERGLQDLPVLRTLAKVLGDIAPRPPPLRTVLPKTLTLKTLAPKLLVL